MDAAIMDVAINDISECKKCLSIVIPADVAEGEYNRRTQERAKTIRLPGFRPGKAPATIIKQRFHKEIKNEVVHELVGTRLSEVIEGKGLRPISQPVVDKLEFEIGSPLTLQISFEVWPEINLPDYTGLTIKVKKTPEITEEEMSKVLEHYREEAVTFVLADDRPVKEGDLLNVHLTAMYEHRGKMIIVKDEDGTFTVGDSRISPAFSEQLIGVKAGDEKEFSITYNELHADKRLAGKTIIHKVKIHDVKIKQLPEINDDLAKDVGQHETLEQLKESIRRDLRERGQHAVEDECREQLVEQLLENNPFDVPDVAVNQRLQAILHDLARLLGQQAVDIKQTAIDWKKVAEDQRPRAVKDVQRSLMLEQIAKKEGLDVLPAEVDMELSRIAKVSGTSLEVVRATYQKQDRLEPLEQELRLKKALDFMYRHAKLINDQGGEL
ncbi:MAG: trigger factor [Acidobacteria bacterium]|nr:trigger factor [Acidobacteriota bacterium]MBI3656908.1 trigger factor [Acidobacteriota bacterium]